jgi:hypothetical protein
MARNLIQFPVKAVWHSEDGSDAHVMDAVGNVVVDGSQWQDPSVTADEHRGAMVFIAMALNGRWRCNQQRFDRESAAAPQHIGKFHQPHKSNDSQFH